MGQQKITPIILAGGQGKRLWPLSRATRPKQFIPLVSGVTLFERTIERCGNREIFNAPIILGSQQHEGLIKELAPIDARIILEPIGKNTAPAIALALHALAGDETLLITPADHFISDIQDFEKTIIAAAGQAEREFLVTIGIPPTSPHTGYGYIQSNHLGDVQRFHEKPDKKRAQEYIEDPKTFWNSGIYVSTAQTLTKEYKLFANDVLEAAKDKAVFKALTPISFDHAIAEKTFNAVMVPAH